jgi:PPP family 3-phenylpropionic acid transporter
MSETGALSRQYFIYFSVLGVMLPYFNLYCYHLGLDGVEIGYISALRSAIMVAFTMVFAGLADRLSARKRIFVMCNCLSALIWVFMIPAATYPQILLVTAVHSIFLGPLIAFLEAFTMDAVGKEEGRYGRVRVWGSFGFILMVISMGKALEIFSLSIVVHVILIAFLLQGVNAFMIKGITSAESPPPGGVLRILLKRQTLVFLSAGFLMLVSHGAYYGFFSIHLEGTGFGPTFIGLSWAVAVVCEITVMFLSRAMLKRFSIERILLFSILAATLRWALLGFFQSAPVILISQCLHAFSYASFHITSIIYMDRLSPDGAKTVGQSVNNSVQYGVGLMAGFFTSGHLVELIGTQRTFLVSAATSLAAFFIMAYGRFRR